MKLSKTSKIGIVIVISFTVLVWGINFLKGRDIFRTEVVYNARYKNVGGLEPSTVVQLNGLKVGYVREIYFAEDLSGDLIVKIAVFNKFPLPVGTTAEIASSDLLGSKIVKLKLGKSSSYYHHNDTINTKIEIDFMTQVSEQISPVRLKAEKLLVSLDSIVSGISLVLNSDSRKSIGKSIEQISLTMENLEHISGDLSQVVGSQKNNLNLTISNLKDLTAHLNSNAAKLENIMGKFSAISDSINPSEIKKTIQNISGAIAGVETTIKNINDSKGSLGLLVNDTTLYYQLAESTDNLNRLIVDLKNNPHRYLKFSAFDFGKEVYLTPKASFHPNDKINFKIFLFSSKVQIPLNSSIFQGIKGISEIRHGNEFEYYAGEDKSYDKIRTILNNTQLSFPQATLKAFLEGEEISIKKALKICSE